MSCILKNPIKPNIHKEEYQALKQLKKDNNRMVLTADKGVSMVVMDRDEYNIKSLFKISSNWLIHVSLKILNMLIVLVIDLILSFNKAFSALCIMYLALGVLMVLFNPTLVGMMLLLRHLRENRR